VNLAQTPVTTAPAPGITSVPAVPVPQAPIPATGYPGGGQPGFHAFYIDHHHAHHHWVGWLVAILVLVLVGLLGYWLGRRSARSDAPVPPPPEPAAPVRATASTDELLSIVRTRYARGEITRKEFRRLSGDLGAWP
jgi:hypothetical protein